MSGFNVKSLAFYGGAIVFVVGLFEVVTNYGERHLKAPMAVDGSYPLSYAANSPACLTSASLVLNIKQSGEYLNASLLPENLNSKKETAADQKPSITGQLSNQQVNISGPTKAKICHNSTSPTQVNIQGQLSGQNLKGYLTLSSLPERFEFTAQRQPPAKTAE